MGLESVKLNAQQLNAYKESAAQYVSETFSKAREKTERFFANSPKLQTLHTTAKDYWNSVNLDAIRARLDRLGCALDPKCEPLEPKCEPPAPPAPVTVEQLTADLLDAAAGKLHQAGDYFLKDNQDLRVTLSTCNLSHRVTYAGSSDRLDSLTGFAQTIKDACLDMEFICNQGSCTLANAGVGQPHTWSAPSNIHAAPN